MSTTVMSDAMVMPATESQPKLIDETTTEVEFVKCDCCGLTEECTPGYIERIRERYKGKWICGLCGEAVKDEIVRNQNQSLITTEEAMARHINFCRTPISSPDLIAAMKQIIRRSLDSPTSVRSMPCSPTTKNTDAGLTRSESCISNLELTSHSSSYYESGDDGQRPNLTPR